MALTDSDGLSQLSIFGNAARYEMPAPTKTEEKKVASGSNIPTLDDPFSNPAHWGILTNQPQQQIQQQMGQQVPQQQYQMNTSTQKPAQNQIVAATADPNNPLALPKDPETFKRVMEQTAQQTTMNVLTNLANINSQKQLIAEQTRKQMIDAPEYRPWYGPWEQQYNKLVNQGYDPATAKVHALEHIRDLAQLGLKPPERQMNAAIPSQYAGVGGGMQLRGGQYRPDEDPNGVQAHFTDEDKLKVREDWINRRNVHSDYVKSGGLNGMSFQEMYPAAFNRGRKDLIIVKS